MKPIIRLAALAAMAAVLALGTAVPSAATEAAVYGSNTTYAGTGKHPKTAVSGLIIDGRTRGLLFICYDYNVITDDKIKGQISGFAERISGDRVEKIATFGKMKVQAFDFDQIPPGAGDQCDPNPEKPDFNFGLAMDCVDSTAPLEAGDIVRFTFKFKKGANLKGSNAVMQVFGSVLPLANLPIGAGALGSVRRAAEGPSAAWLPRPSGR